MFRCTVVVKNFIMVEAVGIEPTSEDSPEKASTSLACLFFCLANHNPSPFQNPSPL